MEKKVIELQIKTNLDKANSDVTKLKSNFKDATSGAKDFDKSISGEKGASFKNLKDTIGGLVPGFGAASQGASAFNKQLLVLVANPIGAVVAAVVLAVVGLVSIFKSFTPVVDKVEQGLSAVSAVVDVIKNGFIALFTGAKSLKESFGGLGGSMRSAAADAIALTKAQQDLDDIMLQQDITTQKLTNRVVKLNIEAKNRNLTEAQKIAKLKEAEKIENEILADKIKSADLALAIARGNIAKQAGLNKQEIKLLKEQGFAYKESIESRTTGVDELFLKLKEAIMARESVESDSNDKLQKNQNKQDAIFEKQQAKRESAQQKIAEKNEKNTQSRLAKEKEEADALVATLKAKQDATIASQNEVTQAISDSQDRQSEIGLNTTEIAIRNIQDKYFRLNELAIQQGRTEEERNILQTQKQNEIDAQNKIKADADAVTKKAKDDKDLADKKAQAEKELEIETALQQAKRNALDTGLNLLQQFAGKNKAVALGILAVQKGLAIADIIVGATKAIGLAKASMAPTPTNPAFLGPGIPNPGFLANLKLGGTSILTTKIGAATSIASILGAGISGAKSITGGAPSSGGGGGGASGGGSQPPAFNVVGASPTSQLAQTIGNQQQQPIKTYVVSKDVTSQQSLDRNIVQSATIG